jgi:hypothetical protein
MLEDNECIVSGLINRDCLSRGAYEHHKDDTKDRFIITRWKISEYHKSWLAEGSGAVHCMHEASMISDDCINTSEFSFSNMVQYNDDQDQSNSQKVFYAVNYKKDKEQLYTLRMDNY